MKSKLDDLTLVAIDLGAESCRVSLLEMRRGRLSTRLVHRFPNGPEQTAAGLVWNFEDISRGVVRGLEECAALAPEGIDSIGVDGWAVDYLRLDSRGNPIGAPFCYRDERTVAAMEAVHQRISSERLYDLTGTRTFRFNTLYQLFADHQLGIPADARWLNLPESILHRLGARPVSEFTNATHTQLLAVRSREWAPEIFEAAGLSREAAPPLVMPGTVVGRLRGPLAELPAFRNTRLIAPACHDTASAVAGIPATGSDWAFLSSGTWSLLGTVTDRAETGSEAREKNFTNHGGVGGSIYFLKNVNGMWLLRQSLDRWKEQGIDWRIENLVSASADLPEPRQRIDVDDPDLLLPGDLPARIDAQLQRRGLPPVGRGAVDAPHYASLIFYSLATRYAEVLRDLAEMTHKRFRRLYVVGGGSRNAWLNQLIEKATGIPIVVGSAESSTLGNFAIQLAALEGGLSAGAAAAASVSQWSAKLAEADSTSNS